MKISVVRLWIGFLIAGALAYATSSSGGAVLGSEDVDGPQAPTSTLGVLDISFMENLHGGCLNICKEFDCGYESECTPGNCDPWVGPNTCWTREDCEQEKDVPMCAGPHPEGTIPECGPRFVCGECTECFCKITKSPVGTFYECCDLRAHSSWQVGYRVCPP